MKSIIAALVVIVTTGSAQAYTTDEAWINGNLEGYHMRCEKMDYGKRGKFQNMLIRSNGMSNDIEFLQGRNSAIKADCYTSKDRFQRYGYYTKYWK
jgi:hypothetical protein